MKYSKKCHVNKSLSLLPGLIAYAENTVILISANISDDTELILNFHLIVIGLNSWLYQNVLVLNTMKTVYMLLAMV